MMERQPATVCVDRTTSRMVLACIVFRCIYNRVEGSVINDTLCAHRTPHASESISCLLIQVSCTPPQISRQYPRLISYAPSRNA